MNEKKNEAPVGGTISKDLQASIEELIESIREDYSKVFQDAERKFASLNVIETLKEKATGEAAEIRDYLINGVRNLDIWNQAILKLSIEKVDPSGRAILLLTNLLYSTEGPFSAVVNVSVHNRVVGEHHDIWDEYHQKFVSSFREIVALALYIKLKFLQIHGLDFLVETCPKELRNAAAHQDFKVNTDGSIILGNGRTITQEEVVRKIIIMNELVKRAFDVFCNDGDGTK